MLMTSEQVEALFSVPANETSEVKIDRWFRVLKEGNAHLRAGGMLSKGQNEVMYFYQEKLDDWRSDYYGQAGL